MCNFIVKEMSGKTIRGFVGEIPSKGSLIGFDDEIHTVVAVSFEYKKYIDNKYIPDGIVVFVE